MDNNEKMIRAQEEKNKINTRLFQSLNNLHRKLNEESSARKTDDHRTHVKRDDIKDNRHFGGDRIHHHHSPKHLSRRAHIYIY
jgi:hypothetical protein